jgi:hypothetical protein
MQWFFAVSGIILPAAVGLLAWRVFRSCQGHIVLRPTGPYGEPLRIHLTRLGVGAMSGIVVALVKSNIDEELAIRLFNGDLLPLLGKFFGYAAAPIFLGAMGGWISDETKVHKIFWIAISMPVILTAAGGGTIYSDKKAPETLPVGKAGWNFEQLLPISPAYGSEAFAADGPSPQGGGNTARENPFAEGLKLFFGQGRDQNRYRVVVHSVLNDKEKAQTVANRLNKDFQLPALATVGERKPGNPYWPVVINGWTTYAEAKKMKDSIQGVEFGFDADNGTYISVKDR